MRVLIPAYQPTALLPQLVEALFDARPLVEILVVDDGSDPSCREHVERCRTAGAQVLHLSRNHGKGHALRTGFAHLSEERFPGPVVTADADGQHTVADILAVADAVDQTTDTGPHLVLGQRRLDGDVPLRSRLGNTLTRLLFRVATGRVVHDTQTGLRAFPASLLPWLTTVRGERYEYELAMLLQAARHRIDLRTVQIQTIYLDGNLSSHFRPVADSIRVYAPLLSFLGTSLTAFLLDTVVLLAAHALGLALLPSVVLARVVSGTANFALNQHVVFPGGEDGTRRRRAGRYTALAVTLLLGNYVLLTALHSTGLPLLAAKLLTEVALVATSYAVQARYVFAHPPGVGRAGRLEDRRATRPACHL